MGLLSNAQRLAMNLPPSISIGSLPPEILIKIVHELISYGPMRGRHRLDPRRDDKVLPPLCLVSMTWKTVITSCPELWSTLSTSYSSSALRMFLKRSAQTPLHIVIEPPIMSSRNQSFHFLNSVKPTSRRWVSYTSWYNDEFALLACPHPNLECLCILGTTNSTWVDTQPGIYVPLPIKAGIQVSLIEFSGHSWNRLRALRLGMLYDFILRPSHMVDILSNSPN